MNLIHKIISVLLISMILWAGQAHADHASISTSTWETQDCKLCQNNLDSPAVSSVLALDIYLAQEIETSSYLSIDISLSKYLWATHRAPPIY